MKAGREPLFVALFERYGRNELEHFSEEIKLKFKFLGWRSSSKSIPHFNGMSRLGVSKDTLIIVQPRPFRRAFPTIAIPRKDLIYVGTESSWGGLSRLDVFEIEGIAGGQLLLPAGFVA